MVSKAPTTCPLLLESHALIDSLGYVDTEFDSQHTRNVVQQLIRAEMTTFAPSQEYLAFLPDYTPEFRDHPRLQNEYKRVAANIPLDAIDMNRYQVKEPTGTHADDVAAWEAAIKQLQVQLEHQNNRYVERSDVFLCWWTNAPRFMMRVLCVVCLQSDKPGASASVRNQIVESEGCGA